jgi:membrane protease YdiL (CAAX protease family)
MKASRLKEIIMDLLVTKVVSSVVQIILFALIPFIWWLVTARKKMNFFKWIGLKKPDSAKFIPWTIGISGAFILVSVFMLTSLKGIEMATSDFNGLGISALPAILVYAVFNTALPEEILFRGFLLKRTANKAGFAEANIFQALIFGIIHGAMFFSLVGPVKAILIILFTGIIGWFMGFINEKISGGSIIPSWIIHAIANIFSGLCSAFLLFA